MIKESKTEEFFPKILSIFLPTQINLLPVCVSVVSNLSSSKFIEISQRMLRGAAQTAHKAKDKVVRLSCRSVTLGKTDP
jgi:hypothetical protein